MRKIKVLFLGIYVIALLAACGGGSSAEQPTNTGNPNPPATTTPPVIITGNVSGTVKDAGTTLPVAGLTVSVNGENVTTSVTGRYSFTKVAIGNRIIITISGAGYAEQSRIVSLKTQDETVDSNIKIMTVGLSKVFDPDSAQTLTVSGSTATVKLSAGSLAQADGSAPSGTVTINLTAIDPTTDIDLMPGDMLTDTKGGTLTQIESFGAITATFKDAAGNNLNIANGSQATIRIPVASNVANVPPTIPLYYYDKEKGLWIEEGSATLDPTKQFYEGSVTHFTTWNADKRFERVLIKGCVEDSAGVRISKLYVFAKGNDYSGQSISFTDASGNFSVYAKSNAAVSIYGVKRFKKTNIIKVNTTTSTLTLNTCLVLADSATAGGTGVSGGTLTLTGVDTAILGTELKFGEVVNFDPTNTNTYLIGFDANASVVNGTISEPDPNNTFSIVISVEVDGSINGIALSITKNGKGKSYICDGSSTGKCGANFVSINNANQTVTFNSAVFKNIDIDSSGNIVIKDLNISGTITWKGFEYFFNL